MPAVMESRFNPKMIMRIREMLGEENRPLSRRRFGSALGGVSEQTIFRWERGQMRPTQLAERALRQFVDEHLTPEQRQELEDLAGS